MESPAVGEIAASHLADLATHVLPTSPPDGVKACVRGRVGYGEICLGEGKNIVCIIKSCRGGRRRYVDLRSRLCPRMRVLPLAAMLALLQIGVVPAIPFAAPVAAATTITVDSTDDTVNPTDGKCTLREAIANVNVQGQATDCAGATGNDTIVFNLPNPSTITLNPANGTLLIGANVTISGPGATALTVDGSCGTACDGNTTPSSGVTVFTIGPRVVTISGMTVQHGFPGSSDPNNSLSFNTGGVFVDGGTLTVSDCIVRNNVGGIGGGIGTRPLGTGDLTVQRSTLTGNRSLLGEGGGLFYAQSGTLRVTNSTVAGNHSTDSVAPFGNGGGVAVDLSFGAAATITNTTIARNIAQGQGGGLFSATTGTTLVNTIVADNTAGASSGQDVHNDAADGGVIGSGSSNNLIGNGDNGNLGGTALADGTNGNHVGTTAQPIDPLLATQLATSGSANGTQTLALLPGSLAIDAGAMSVNVPLADQRGVNRVSAPDIGAFESQGFVLHVGTGSGQATDINTPFPAALTATVTANAASAPFNETVDGGKVTFTAPAPSGASATFDGTTPNPATISGGAVSVKVIANGNAGSYSIRISATGATAIPSAYALTNNALPTATAHTFSGNEDAPLAVTAPGVLAGASGGTGVLTAVLVSGPAHNNGPFTLNADGSFTYTPTDFSGADSFTWQAKDALGGLSAPATVTLTIAFVNDQPSFTASNPPAVAANSGQQTVTNWATFTPGPGANEASQTVLAYTVSNVSNPGLFTTPPAVDASGTLTYTPATNTQGSTTFDVKVQDNGGTANGGIDTSATQTFTITVQAGTPVAHDDAYSTRVDTTLTVDAAHGVLANDTLGVPAGAIQSNTNPAHGTLTFHSSDGSFTYVPTAGFTGSDSFTYTLGNTGGTATGTVTITVVPIASIAVTPANVTLKVGQVQQYTAIATYADSTTADVTRQVTWSSDNTAVAVVNTGGTVTGASPGQAHITVTQGSVSGQVSVTVSGGTSVGIAPAPQPASRPGAAAAPPVGGQPPAPNPAPRTGP